MRIFKISKDFDVVCRSERTRYGFRHLASLMKEGIEIQKGKCCYYNRTWERYTFESVLYEVVRKAHKNRLISEDELEMFRKYIYGDHEDRSQFTMTKTLAMMGELFCDTQKSKNDWKVRMIKTGLGNKGLIIPDDWESLDEDTKEERLNKVIHNMGV